jgi:NAD(P)-dependent dehydrogenase (short-subunit alcohol dehydrogenase family)
MSATATPWTASCRSSASRPDTFQAHRDAVEVNLTGAFHTVDACLPTLIEQGDGGSIVITSSTSGIHGLVDGSRGSMGYALA